MNKALKYLLIVLLFSVTTSAFSQCRSFTRKKCMPGLLPFIHNGQMNNITLFPGESAQLELTFFADQDYRLIVCNQDVLGDDVYFEVQTPAKEIVYSSKDTDMNIWDFSVATTQNLTIVVYIPKDEESHNNLNHSGCVSVVVGFKE